MSGARLIETRGRTAGLVVRLSTGRFRFFSSSQDTDALDGHVFRSVKAASRAIETLRSERRKLWPA